MATSSRRRGLGGGRWASGMKKSRTLVWMILCCRLGRTIDAAGKIVVPGGVEPHAHLDIFDLTNPDSGRSTLGPEEDTRGMAFGGTTTHLDFCFIEPGMDIPGGLEARVAR